MEKNSIIEGQPGLVLLPSKAYSLKKIIEFCVISIPMCGKLSELYPDFFELIKKDKDVDDFVTVLQEESRNQIMLVTAVGIMFAANKYPDLKDNQIFSISLISFDNKDNTLHIVGDVLEFME